MDKNYLDMLPSDAFFSEEEGIIIAKSIDNAIENGTHHFKIGSDGYEMLPDIQSVMKYVGKSKVLISYHPKMNSKNKDVLYVGLHDLEHKRNVLIPAPAEVEEQIREIEGGL